MPANILNLPDFKVQRVEEADHDYHVYAEVSNPPGVCTACGSDRLIGHGRNEQVIRDLPTHGKRLAIYVDTRRWRCQSCGLSAPGYCCVSFEKEVVDWCCD